MKTWIALLLLGLVAFASYTVGAATGYFGSLHAFGGGEAGAERYDVEPAARATLAVRAHRFVPDTLSVPAASLVEIEVANEDDVLHTFTYDNAGSTYDHVLQPGETIRVLARFDESGIAGFRCRPHETMTGSIHAEA